jgi:hypothetical protein
MLSSNLSAGSKNIRLTRLICFFWIVAKIICWKLWLSDRLFPVVPVFNFLFVPSAVHLVLFILSLAALLALFVYPTKPTIQVGIIIIELLSCLLDQNRWQPWEFQFFFLLLVIIINRRKEKDIFSLFGFILASTYFYSGLSKLNPVFIHSVWHDTILTGLLHLNYNLSYQPLIYHAGYLLGVIEIILSIGLFFQRTKRITCISLIIMHLLILLMFGPWGINYDAVIWPWNVGLIIFISILILNNPGFTISSQSLIKGSNKLIVLVFGILPLLNLFGYWEYFFSSGLFSCRPPDMYIYVKRDASNKTLEDFSMKEQPLECINNNTYVIYTRDWAFREMLAPENPEIRIYKEIKKQLLKRYPKLDASFITYTYMNGKKVKQELK